MSHVWLAGMRWLRGSLTKEAFGGPWGHEHPSGNEKTGRRAVPAPKREESHRDRGAMRPCGHP